MARFPVERVYPEHRFGGFTRVDGTIAFYSRVRALLPSCGTVLDIGCGRGAHQDNSSRYRREIRDLRGPNRTVVGIDIDRHAKDNPTLDEFRLLRERDSWPLDTQSVDLIVADYVLEHVREPDQFVREVHRVLKPGGFFCARTPNAWNYVVLVSRLIPNPAHGRVLQFAQDSRREEDVFPTLYRCNTRRTLRRLLARAGFDYVVYRTNPEPAYLAFSGTLYRLFAILHRVMPPVFQSTLLAFARKPEGAPDAQRGVEAVEASPT